MKAGEEKEGWRFRWAAGWRCPYSLTSILPSSMLDMQLLRNEIETRERAILADLGQVDGLHALRVVVIPDEPGQVPRLMINSVSDCAPGEHRRRVAAALAPRLGDLVEGRPATPDAFAEALRVRRVPERTLFLASPGVTLRQIREEARLRDVLRDWTKGRLLDGSLQSMSLEEARLAARDHVLKLNDPECARGVAQPLAPAWRRRVEGVAVFLLFPFFGVLGKDIQIFARRIRPAASRLRTRLAIGLWWIYAAPFTALAFLGVRLMELIEPDFEPEPASEAKLLHVESVEDARPKNELTVWFPVKPSFIGRFLMRLVLFGSELGTRHLWTKGALAGAENIHFARLLLADKGRRMVFMSDYDGSFDAYIDHFIGIGGKTRAVIPISSRVHGCPKTRWLYLPAEPVAFRRRWRDMARSYQLQASIRFVAYPTLSANDIINHSTIRERLFAERLSPEELEDWAKRI